MVRLVDWEKQGRARSSFVNRNEQPCGASPTFRGNFKCENERTVILATASPTRALAQYGHRRSLGERRGMRETGESIAVRSVCQRDFLREFTDQSFALPLRKKLTQNGRELFRTKTLIRVIIGQYGFNSMDTIRFGNKMKTMVMLIIFCGVHAFLLAEDTEVFLPEDELPPSQMANVTVIAQGPKIHKLCFPLGMLGESYTGVLQKADSIVAGEISSVTPVGITCLDDWYVNGTSPLFWYQVTCEIKKTIKGDFPFAHMRFITCYGSHRQTWPYIKGFCYRFGLKKSGGEWNVIAQVRTSSFFPYRIEDRISYNEAKREMKKIDFSRWDKFIFERNCACDKKCLDVSVEKGEYIAVTFAGDSLFGGLDADYSKDITVKYYSLNTGTQVENPVKDSGHPCRVPSP